MLIATTAYATTLKAPTNGEIKGEITDILQPTSQQLSNPTPQNLKDYLSEAVTKYGGNYYQLYNVIQCESSWNPNAKNPTSSAFGIAQFMPSTFNDYCGGDYKNPYDQIKCMVIAFTDNKQHWWECWKMLNN